MGARIATDSQWRFPPIKDVPKKYRRAVTLFEDRRFDDHWGVDPIAIGRAFYLNLKHRRVISGGSTITMQVIRLSRGKKSRNYLEKLIEMVQAWRLDLRYSKDEIIALYASYAPYGGNIVGLRSAAWRYFGRTPEQLTWGESTLLAVLPNAPGLIHPGRNRDALKKKRNLLLGRLYKAGDIDLITRDLAMAEPIPAQPRALPNKAPHLLNYLTEKKSDYLLNTTIKGHIQQNLNHILDRRGGYLIKRNINNLAALIINNRTLEVIAYGGNIPKGQDHWVDLIQTPRSTGSILKPFLYGAMLHSGDIIPSMVVRDIPTRYHGYIPKNFDQKYRGIVTAEQALAKSLNIPAVRMLYLFGVDRFYDFLQKLGMTTLFRSAQAYGLPLILGGAEGTLWELSRIYANFAHVLLYPESDHYYDLRILKKEPLKSIGRLNLDRGSIYLVFKALLEVTRPGSGKLWRDFKGIRRVAWKTGTSFGARDAWAIGITPDYTVGVWAGNARGMGANSLTGVSVAAPVLFELFNMLPRKTDWFKKPEKDLKTVDVCVDSGFLKTEYCSGAREEIPKDSLFNRISPYHKRIHLDQTGLFRVNGKCESPSNMRHENRFVLPPTESYFYMKYHPAYQPLPPLRKDCLQSEGKGMIAILYPAPQTKVYLPIGLDQKRGAVLLQAVHREESRTLFWHVDNDYIGSTEIFHEQSVKLTPGKHTLIVIDENGNSVQRSFEVLTISNKK